MHHFIIKINHHDKDESIEFILRRSFLLGFMALSDLASELETPEFTLESASQDHLGKIVLARLEDSSTDVQTVAVRWFAPLLLLF